MSLHFPRRWTPEIIHSALDGSRCLPRQGIQTNMKASDERVSLCLRRPRLVTKESLRLLVEHARCTPLLEANRAGRRLFLWGVDDGAYEAGDGDYIPQRFCWHLPSHHLPPGRSSASKPPTLGNYLGNYVVMQLRSCMIMSTPLPLALGN